MLSPGQLASNFGFSTATLADWRSQKRGPDYLKVGGKIWYPEEFVDSWAESEIRRTRDGIEDTRRKVALPVQAGRKGIRGNHRLGRHHTKRESSTAGRDGVHPGAA